MKKRLMAFVLISVMLMSMLSSIVLANVSEFAGGDGSVENPYLITNKTQLNNVRNYPEANFKLVNDIVFEDDDFEIGGEFYNEGFKFIPIETFSGTFDGCEFAIVNLQMNITDEYAIEPYIGLFARNLGTIKNLSIKDAQFGCRYLYSVYTGAIAGYNKGTIINCNNTSDIFADSQHNTNVGGIAGYNIGQVIYCYNTGNIKASQRTYSDFSQAGGIVGEGNGTISYCYNTGDIFASGYYCAVTGGIAGSASETNNCYNVGKVEAQSGDYEDFYVCVSGINGRNGTVDKCYNIGQLEAESYSINAGPIAYNGKVTNCYYVKSQQGYYASGKTLEELKNQSVYKSFDFDTVWTMEGLDVYPYPELRDVSMYLEAKEIEIVAKPEKTVYNCELFDTAGGKLDVIYAPDIKKAVDITSDMISGFDPSKTGKQVITIKYEDFVDTYEVTLNTAWAFDETEGKLTISGDGATADYNSDMSNAPWFSFKDKIKHVVFESGITGIGMYAFKDCTNLEKVTLFPGMKNIGKMAFYNCNALSDVVFKGTKSQWDKIIVDVNNEKFTNANLIKDKWGYDKTTNEIALGENIGNFASKQSPWYDVANDVKTIIVEDGVTEIGNWTFAYCKNATEVVIPDSVKKIGNNAFYRCVKLETVVIPESVTVLGSGVFAYCNNLKTVNIPAKITKLNAHTFLDCKLLANVTYNGSGKLTFEKGNEDFESVYTAHEKTPITWKIEDGVLTISGTDKMPDYAGYTAPWYAKASEITKIVIEEGVTNIGAFAFAKLSKVTEVEIASTVKTIGNNAFYKCTKLITLDIKNVTKVMSGVFAYCSSLEVFEFSDNLTSIGNSSFSSCNNLMTINGDLSKVTIGAKGNSAIIG